MYLTNQIVAFHESPLFDNIKYCILKQRKSDVYIYLFTQAHFHMHSTTDMQICHAAKPAI